MAESKMLTELNQLYWETDRSVSDIADQLEISRRALYDGIEPRPAGVACAECGAPLGYRNRTALENREAECAECGLTLELEEDEAYAAEPEVEQFRAASELSPVRRVPASGDGPVLGLLLLAGLAAGAFTVFWVRRG